jgi:serine/threonine-protein kinase
VPRCPTCQAEFDKGEQFCPRDGSPLASTPPREDPLLGRVLGGRYRLTVRLGQGGMGTVYSAVHTLMDKPLAVKILRGELATDGEAVARFHREARSASRLDHDHCIRVTDFGQTDDRLLYLAMELLEGRSLNERMKEGRVPVAEAVRIVHAVAMALEHAHEAGVIHRDLKPDNIFLARRSRGREVVKVLDFGLAKLASDSGISRSITRDGTVFGTPEYMAPEQAQGEALDARTDLYALGVILYHLLTGELPFHGDTFVALLTKHVREAPRRPRDLDPSIPPELEEIVLRCMQKRPEQRFSNATAVADALAPFVGAAEPTGPTMHAKEPTTDPGVTPVGARAMISSATPTSMAKNGGLDSATELLFERPRRALRWSLGFAAVALAAAGIVGGRSLGRPSSSTTPVASTQSMMTTPQPTDELAGIRRLIDGGSLEEAAAQLDVLHRKGETAALERISSEVAERRGRRLEALARLHRAKTLAPTDPSVRLALASLLLRLDQKVDGCHQARRALDLATAASQAAAGREDDTIRRARGILQGAACPANPGPR